MKISKFDTQVNEILFLIFIVVVLLSFTLYNEKIILLTDSGILAKQQDEKNKYEQLKSKKISIIQVFNDSRKLHPHKAKTVRHRQY